MVSGVRHAMPSTNQSFQVQTDSGIRSVYIRKTDEGEHITSVRVDMGVMANLGEQRVLLKAKEEWTDFTGGSFPVQYVSAGISAEEGSGIDPYLAW